MIKFLLCLALLVSIGTAQVNKTVLTNLVGYRNFVATAYCLRGKTASGEVVRFGIVAADPRVFELGTKISILTLGNFQVKDTGSAIKGNRIDIWLPSCASAKKFGRRNIAVKTIK